MKNILDFTSLSFKNKPEQLHPEAYIFRNFIDKEEIKDLQEILFTREVDPEDGSAFFPELDKYRKKVQDLFTKDIQIDAFDKVTVHNSGGMGLHHDIISYDLVDILVPDSHPNKEKISLACYTFLFYLNDNFEGGEISYPEYNVDHKPTAGDLIIHTTEVIHGVKKIISGFRYRYQGIIFDDFYVDADKFDKSMLPDYNDTRSYKYDIKGKNERIAKFRESYIERGLY